MPVLGMYTKNEVAEIKRIAITDTERVTNVKKQKEINKLKDKHEEEIRKIEERYGQVYGDMILEGEGLKQKLKLKEAEANVLRTVLVLETDKKIKRLEIIAQRTRKARTKKKIENRIIDYEMRKVAYEAK